MVSYPWLEDPWNEFAGRLEQQRMPHALLLAGPPGTGKGQFARTLTAALLCLEPGAEPCGTCQSCRLLQSGAHPDRFFLEPEENKTQIQVDPVRELIGKLVLTTTISPRKVAVLRPAEAMNRNAANALLKNLEEPPGETVIILVSHDPSGLPITIRSRCQALTVRAPDQAAAVDWLEATHSVGREQALLALEASGGSPLEAAELISTQALEAFVSVRQQLGALMAKPGLTGATAAEFADMPAARLWTWLSMNCGQALKTTLQGERPDWVISDRDMPRHKLAALQLKADRNRNQLGGGLRSDLLLQEWLLEWARLPAREPIR